MIKIYDVDAAGVLFFANQFRLVYDAYEAFLEEKGFPVSRFIHQSPYLLPFVSAKTNYQAPLYVGDSITVQLELVAIGDSSVTLNHRIYKADQTLVGEGETINVAIDKKTGQKIPFPEELKDLFEI